MVMIAPTTYKRKNDSPNFGTHNESLLTRPMTAPLPAFLFSSGIVRAKILRSIKSDSCDQAEV